MGRFIIDYKGDIKTLKRLCQRVQELPELGTEHDQAIGMLKVWATHNDEPIADHEGVYLSFHGVSAPDVENNLLWH